MSGPDVTPVGFAATEGPDAPLRRRRNPIWLLTAVLLVAAGAGGIGWFVAEQAGGPGEEDAVARGTIAPLDAPETPVVRFRHVGGDLTVWLDADGIHNSNARETIVASVNCTTRQADGGSTSFRGAVQGSSVTIGGRSTIGAFSAPAGELAIACRQERFGRRRGYDRLRLERSFFVTPGSPDVGWAPWVALFAGIPLLIAAVPAYGRWRGGALRLRRRG